MLPSRRPALPMSGFVRASESGMPCCLLSYADARRMHHGTKAFRRSGLGNANDRMEILAFDRGAARKAQMNEADRSSPGLPGFIGPLLHAPARLGRCKFPRYFRVHFDGDSTLIVMDAPPTQEDCRPWLSVQRLFLEAGAHVPKCWRRILTVVFCCSRTSVPRLISSLEHCRPDDPALSMPTRRGIDPHPARQPARALA